MISALSSLDLSLFRVVNAIVWPDWASAILSALARSNLWIAPIALAFLILAVLGGRRERTYVAAALLTLALTEVLSSGVLKPLIARPRPCNVLEGVRLLGGCTQSFAMPSGHAANSFAQAMVLGLFYRSSFFFSLPLAAMVALSRVTDGKHYPSDVLVGAVVGVLVAAAVVRGLRARVEAGDRRLSRLLSPAGRVSGPEARAGMRPASVFASALGVAMIIRLWYVGWANLTPEEAILWDRARFISGWGWLSATPAGALAWAGTRLLGHTELGVRVGALAASLLTSVLLFFWARKAFPWSRWAGTIAGTGILAAPLFGIGGAHLTAVTLSLLFWTGALAASQWAASRPTPKASGAWALWGLCVGLGLRTDPSAALLVPVTGLYLVVRSDGRPWLRRPAPYLGLALAAALAILPWVSGAGPGQAPAGGAEAGAVGGPGGLGFLLGWHALNVGPLLAAFMIWGVVWALRPALREGRTEYFHPVWFSLVLGGTFLAWSGWSGVRPEWTVGAWIPAWMAAVGATTEILRRGSRGSLRLFKVLTLVLLLGVVQTAVLLNVRLLRKLDVKTLPKTDPAASVLGWRALGGRVGRSLSDMGEGTLLLTDNRGTAAELSFYAKSVYRPKVRVVRAEGSPLGLPETAAGREAILVMVGEWTEPPETVRPLFRSWEREDLFRVRRRKSGVIRSVTLFRLYGYAGPPSGENSGSGEAL